MSESLQNIFIYAVLPLMVLVILYTQFSNKSKPSSKPHATSSSNTPKPAEKPILNAKEVSKHNTVEDAWIIMEDKVYDITKYIDVHPGGEEVLFPHFGKDATEAFRGPQHPVTVDDVIATFYIGDLVK